MIIDSNTTLHTILLENFFDVRSKFFFLFLSDISSIFLPFFLNYIIIIPRSRNNVKNFLSYNRKYFSPQKWYLYFLPFHSEPSFLPLHYLNIGAKKQFLVVFWLTFQDCPTIYCISIFVKHHITPFSQTLVASFFSILYAFPFPKVNPNS